MKLVMRPYQEEAVDRFEKDGRLILADDCGLGKTLIGIETGHRLNSFPALVICNKTARAQWQDMILSQYPRDDVLIADKIAWKYDSLRERGDLQWVVVSWDELIMKSGQTLRKVVWPLVIADEVHKAKNRKASRTEALCKIDASRKLGLSATPYEKSDEVWSLLHWLDQWKFPGYHAFCATHFTMIDNFWSGRQEPSELKDPEAFNRLLEPWFLRRTKEQVLPDLPPKIEIEVKVQMTERQRRIYNDLANSKDVVVNVEDEQLIVLNALSLLTKLQQVSTSPSLLGLSVKEKGSKIAWVEDHIGDHPERKVVLFTRFIETARELAGMLKCECLAEGGGSPRPFQRGHHQYVVGTIDSMGESLDFPMADDAVFVETHHSSIKMQQAIDRVHRGNITTPKNIYYLLSSPTDRRILKTAKDKIEERDMALSFARARIQDIVETG